MRSGCSARETLDALLVIDADRDLRQVAVVDAEGEVAAHTGRACVAEAGHVEGLGFSVQANMMLNDTVPAAMKEAYVRGDGDFAERLVQAMEGAQREGGDFRGVQSAGLVVVSGERHARPWEGRVFHIRVDDHAEPLAELRRLLDLARGYGAMERAMERLRVLDLEGAEGQVAEAIARLPRRQRRRRRSTWGRRAKLTASTLISSRVEMPLFSVGCHQEVSNPGSGERGPGGEIAIEIWPWNFALSRTRF